MLRIYLTSEYDTILARQKAQEIAKLLNYDFHEQVRIATAVSESVRILLSPACKGEVVFFIDTAGKQPKLGVRVKSAAITNNNHVENNNILNTLVELKEKQEEVNTLIKELQETNKGVFALYNELDEKTEFFRHVNDIKNSSILTVSHELRTPIHSILGMAKLLLDKVDGNLSTEQAIQVGFIQNSAQGLLEMVNDILDISKIEAGKIMVYPVKIELGEIFAALKGMFKSLNIKDDVNLVFELTEDIPTLYTDERKLAQILRNFISNALKFTQRGEVKVFAALSENHKEVTVYVSDTGIGIAEEEQESIFKEYVQIYNSIQRNVKGIGLGLPLSKKLAELLNGNISVQSKLGAGSIFSIKIPVIYNENDNSYFENEDMTCYDKKEIHKKKILVIDDDKSFHYLLQKTLFNENHSVLEAINGSIGIRYAINEKPAVILLDLSMPGLSGYEVLERLESNVSTKDIPVIIMTPGVIDEYQYDKLKDKNIAVFYKKDLLYKEQINLLLNMVNKYMF